MSQSKFGYRSSALDVVSGIDLSGRHAIVTGGYSGIGLETVRALASAGAAVTIACRDLSRAEATATSLNASSPAGSVTAAELDLGQISKVRAFTRAYCKAHDKLDILINNAAVMACPLDHTADGFEMQFGTNHLGHFALFQGLLPLLQASGKARVVCLSSTGHFNSPVVFEDVNFKDRIYDPWSSYGQAKSANALMAVGIQSRYSAEGIEAFAVHPGGIMTNLQRHLTQEEMQARGWISAEGEVNERFKTPEQGASTSVWAATSPDLAGRGGRYLEDCNEAPVVDERPADFKGVMRYAVAPDIADKLWDLSEALLAGY